LTTITTRSTISIRSLHKKYKKYKKCRRDIMNAAERKEWHNSEHHVMVEKDSLDWKRAERYQAEHSRYYDGAVFINEAWRDKDNYLCVQYASGSGEIANWFHYTVNNGELEWW
jgi:hypothetical protein